MLTVLMTFLISLAPAKASTSTQIYEDLSTETSSCRLVVTRNLQIGEAALFCTSSNTEIAQQEISQLKYQIAVNSRSEDEARNELEISKNKIIEFLDSHGFRSDKAECEAPQLSGWKSQQPKILAATNGSNAARTINEGSIRICIFQR